MAAGPHATSEALSALLSKATGPARCVLPVPGDPGGLPRRSADRCCCRTGGAGTGGSGFAGARPHIVTTRRRGDLAGTTRPGLTSYAADPRAVMSRGALAAHASRRDTRIPTVRRPGPGLLRQRLQRLDLVPLAPGSSGPAAELARLSARLLTIVAAAISGRRPGTSAAGPPASCWCRWVGSDAPHWPSPFRNLPSDNVD